MAGQYNNPFGNNYPLLPPYYTAGDHGQPVMRPPGFVRGLHQFQPQQRPEAMNTNFLEFGDESRQPMLPAQGGARVRRRVGAGGEHVKFRRTRSGCYTCRNRRVKCDEARPTCERCRKGNRECVYPEQSSSSKSRRGSTKDKSGDGDGSSHGEESDQVEGAAGPDEEEPSSAGAAEPSSAISAKSESPAPRAASDPPSLTHGKSPTPSTEGSVSIDTFPVSVSARTPEPLKPSKLQRWLSQKKAPELRKDLRFFLDYARKNLGTHHYGFKYTESEFLKTTLIEAALRYEPLLYAVVGFAAYHYTLTKPKGRIQDFLDYYTQSVSLLRQSLKKEPKPSVATLLTVLQLATIEEYLGDWVNCMAHQAAACQILTDLYTPQTIMEHENTRMILHWYIRFDLFAGVMSGYSTVLSREWFETCYQYFLSKMRERPDDILIKYEERWARLRLLAADIALLCGRKGTNDIPDDKFKEQWVTISEEISNWENDLHPALRDRSKLITDFGSPLPQREPDDIVDPYSPNTMYGGDLFLTNILALDYWGLELLFNHQLAEMFLGTPRSPHAQDIAYKMCQMFESIQKHPQSPPGIILGMQATLGVSAMFLPPDDKHSMWARKKLATVEALGYVYPSTFRMRMSNYWNVDVSDWWLPNEEGLLPIIRSIRAFVADRTKAPRDKKGEDLRDMKGFFSALTLSDSSSPESAHGQPPAAQRSFSIKEHPQPGQHPRQYQLRRTASESAASGHPESLDLAGSAADVTFGPASASIADETIMFGDESPEFAWGYEQRSWDNI